MNIKTRHHLNQRGFTMVELSVILTILAIVAATLMMDMVTGSATRAQAVTTKRMEAIQEQLLKHYIVFFRVPCPARTDENPNEDGFGEEAGSQGECIHSTGVLRTSATGRVSMGSVPTRLLNLPDEYQLDGWGRRIDYIVDFRYTLANERHPNETAIAVPSNLSDDGFPDIQLRDTDAGNVLDYVPVLLMSHGANGSMAIPAYGATLTPDARVSTLPSGGNTDEQRNVTYPTDYFVYKPFQPSMTGDDRFDLLVYPVTLDF